MSAEQARAVADWNDRHLVGTLVRFWPGAIGRDPAHTGKVWHVATILGGHTPVAWVRDECHPGQSHGCIALTHTADA